MSGTSGRSGEKPARAGRSIRITPRSCFRKGLFHLVMIALEQKLCPVNRLQADPRPAGAAGLRGRFGKQALVDTLPPVATLKGGLFATHSRWFQSLKPDLSSGIIFFLKNHPAIYEKPTKPYLNYVPALIVIVFHVPISTSPVLFAVARL